ncbi:hypothetical protein, partial [Clostridioides difficile]|uniref:hypothetical protein n=1 Tax=Clostridioides difficile TaxID=1496 RepID=UPI0018F8BC21
MKSILIMGGSDFIGSALAKRLIKCGHSNLLKNRDSLDIKIRENESKLHEIEIELIKARELYVEKKL